MAHPGGRPRIEIDKTQFEKLCALQCTKSDIAGWFGVSEDTIERWCKREYRHSFAVVFKQKRTKGLASLRKAGFSMAQKVPSVHIFYAKNYLGMSDRVEVNDEKADESLNRLISAIKDV